jgi:hypothetical protein
MKYISMAVILITCCLLLYSLYDVKHGITDMDRLEYLLAPVKKKLTPSSVIGFDSNLPAERVDFYCKAVLAMAPSIIVKSEGYDTLLSVSDTSLPAKAYDKYQCIGKGKQYEFAYSLMVLKK